MSGRESSVDMAVLVERGRQLHSAAIGDVLISLFSWMLTRQDQGKGKPEALHHAPGHQVR